MHEPLKVQRKRTASSPSFQALCSSTPPLTFLFCVTATKPQFA